MYPRRDDAAFGSAGYLAVIFVSGLVASSAFSQDSQTSVAEREPAEIVRPSYEFWDRVTGDWGGARTRAEQLGFNLEATYTGEYSSVWNGGIRQRASYRNVTTVDLTVDLARATGLEGGTFFMQYLSVNPESGGSLDSGDLQIYSNLESPNHIDAIYEAWYEQRFGSDRFRLKIGKFDANSEFADVEAGVDFTHSSAGFSPTILTFPSYPDSATAINLFAELYSSPNLVFTLGYGLYDGALGVDGIPTGNRGPSTFFTDDQSNDYFQIAEAELRWGAGGEFGSNEPQDPSGSGRVCVGGWFHNGRFVEFGGETNRDTAGLYLTAEYCWLSRDEGWGSRGVFLFGQYGYADESISPFAHHLGGGVAVAGLPGGPEEDRCGLYLSWVDLSDRSGAGFSEDELAIEIYYRFQVTPFLYLQPDTQYIVNPGGGSLKDAWIGGIRVGLVF